ncbi:MAG TPA: prolyl-tRNA synthetase associated domain-containing protein [Azospirillaceae bacterium]|nr:prolyl-tRNA synthetase associated domain-containing protein [Azospirillaceae bacterium]
MTEIAHPHSAAMPADAAGLPTSPQALLDRLAALGIPTRTVSHPPLHTVEEAKALRGDLPGGHCKNLFLKDAKGQLWLVVALEDTRVDLKRLPDVIGSARLSFGKPERLFEVLGVRPGSVTPFALVNDRTQQVRVVLERGMLAHDPLHYHPLTNTMTTALPAEGLLSFVRACGHSPLVVDLPRLA